MRIKDVVAAAAGLLLSCSAAPGAGLEPGDPAPDFALPGSDGKVHRLSEHRGRRAVVLAWFPKAFTGG